MSLNEFKKWEPDAKRINKAAPKGQRFKGFIAGPTDASKAQHEPHYEMGKGEGIVYTNDTGDYFMRCTCGEMFPAEIQYVFAPDPN